MSVSSISWDLLEIVLVSQEQIIHKTKRLMSSKSSSGSSSKRPAVISKEYYDKATSVFARDHSGEVESAGEESDTEVMPMVSAVTCDRVFSFKEIRGYDEHLSPFRGSKQQSIEVVKHLPIFVLCKLIVICIFRYVFLQYEWCLKSLFEIMRKHKHLQTTYKLNCLQMRMIQRIASLCR